MRIAEELVTRGYSAELAARALATPIAEHGGIKLSHTEARKYNLLRRAKAECLRARGEIAPFECELGFDIDKRTGFPLEGATVPLGVLFGRDFNVGTPTQAGNLAGDAPRAWAYAGDALRNASAIGRLGVLTVSGFTGAPVIPRFATAPAGAAAAEVGAAADGSATTDGHALAPHRITARLRVSLQTVTQADPAAAEMVRRQLATGLQAELERQFFNGTGSNDELTGLRSASGVQSVVMGTDGAALTFAKLADVENAAHDATASDLSGFAVNKATRRFLRTLARGTGLDYVWQSTERPLLGHRAAVTNNLPANLTKGTGSNLSALVFGNDWSLALVALFGEGIGLVVDRYTRADRGEVVLTANLYADVCFLQPGAFVHTSDASTVEE